jgi:hypothetical protein
MSHLICHYKPLRPKDLNEHCLPYERVYYMYNEYELNPGLPQQLMATLHNAWLELIDEAKDAVMEAIQYESCGQIHEAPNCRQELNKVESLVAKRNPFELDQEILDDFHLKLRDVTWDWIEELYDVKSNCKEEKLG